MNFKDLVKFYLKEEEEKGSEVKVVKAKNYTNKEVPMFIPSSRSIKLSDPIKTASDEVYTSAEDYANIYCLGAGKSPKGPFWDKLKLSYIHANNAHVDPDVKLKDLKKKENYVKGLAIKRGRPRANA